MEHTISPPYGYLWFPMEWDRSLSSDRLKMDTDNMTILGSDGGCFRTAIANCPFTQGRKYYFQILVMNGNIKIGVCRKTAFSDTKDGWAIYNGELRHCSNSSGAKYGKKAVPGDVVGVMLDTVEGTLSYSINHVNYGVAFKDPAFKEGELYGAIAALSTSDKCKLNFPSPED